MVCYTFDQLDTETINRFNLIDIEKRSEELESAKIGAQLLFCPHYLDNRKGKDGQEIIILAGILSSGAKATVVLNNVEFYYDIFCNESAMLSIDNGLQDMVCGPIKSFKNLTEKFVLFKNSLKKFSREIQHKEYILQKIYNAGSQKYPKQFGIRLYFKSIAQRRESMKQAMLIKEFYVASNAIGKVIYTTFAKLDKQLGHWMLLSKYEFTRDIIETQWFNNPIDTKADFCFQLSIENYLSTDYDGFIDNVIISYDIETCMIGEGKILDSCNEIFNISMVAANASGTKKISYNIYRTIDENYHPDIAVPDIYNICCKNEKEVLLSYAIILGKLQPDFIISYNGGGYDIPMILLKARINNVFDEMYGTSSLFFIDQYSGTFVEENGYKYQVSNKKYTNWAKIHTEYFISGINSSSKLTKSKNLIATKIDNTTTKYSHYWSPPGCIAIDVYLICMKEFPKEPSYKLDHFLEKFNIPQKLDMSYSDVWINWKTSINLTKVFDYCVYDSDACLQLFLSLQVLGRNRELSKLTHLPMFQCIYLAGSSKVDNLMIKYASQDDYSVIEEKSYSFLPHLRHHKVTELPSNKGGKVNIYKRGKIYIEYISTNAKNYFEEEKKNEAAVLDKNKITDEVFVSEKDKITVSEKNEAAVLDKNHISVSEKDKITDEAVVSEKKHISVSEKNEAVVLDKRHIADNISVSEKDGVDKFLCKIPVPVEAGDFMSLYPSIINAYNLSCDKITQNPDELDPNLEYMHLVEESLAYENKNIWILKHNNQQCLMGVAPKALQTMGILRANARKLMGEKIAIKKEYGGSDKEFLQNITNEINSLDSRQLAIKIIMNTLYGTTSSAINMLSHYISAFLTTKYGRKYLKIANKFLIDNDCVVCYNDTDSCYFHHSPKLFYPFIKKYYSDEISQKELNTSMVEISIDKSHKLLAQLNEHLEKVSETKFLVMVREETLFPAIFCALKKYFGMKHIKSFTKLDLKEVLYKGISVVTRGETKYAKDYILKQIETILISGKIDVYQQVLTELCNQIQVCGSVDYAHFEKRQRYKPQSANNALGCVKTMEMIGELSDDPKVLELTKKPEALEIVCFVQIKNDESIDLSWRKRNLKIRERFWYTSVATYLKKDLDYVGYIQSLLTFSSQLITYKTDFDFYDKDMELKDYKEKIKLFLSKKCDEWFYNQTHFVRERNRQLIIDKIKKQNKYMYFEWVRSGYEHKNMRYKNIDNILTLLWSSKDKISDHLIKICHKTPCTNAHKFISTGASITQITRNENRLLCIKRKLCMEFNIYVFEENKMKQSVLTDSDYEFLHKVYGDLIKYWTNYSAEKYLSDLDWEL